MRKGYTFADVAIEPVFNNVDSRLDETITLSSKLCLGVETGIPFIPANMDTVIGTDLAEILVSFGGVPIFHRFTDFETKLDWLKRFPNCFISAGISEDQIKEATELIDRGLRGVCIDIAHGHDSRVEHAIEALKKNTEVKVIAGNVCSVDGYKDLVNWGADAVKVGIGPGAACTTRKTTGFGVPQFSAVYEIGKEAMKLHVPFIADGGISGPDDIAKALAAGASTVMMGKMFAITDESAAEKGHQTFGTHDVRYVARYRGQASAEFQNDFYGGMRAGTVPEGEAMYAEVSGSARDYLEFLSGCLRTTLTYGGSRDIYEFQRKVRGNFWSVSDGYNLESGVREG